MPLLSRLGQLKMQINDGAGGLVGGEEERTARLSNATMSRTHELNNQLDKDWLA